MYSLMTSGITHVPTRHNMLLRYYIVKVGHTFLSSSILCRLGTQCALQKSILCREYIYVNIHDPYVRQF